MMVRRFGWAGLGFIAATLIQASVLAQGEPAPPSRNQPRGLDDIPSAPSDCFQEDGHRVCPGSTSDPSTPPAVLPEGSETAGDLRLMEAGGSDPLGMDVTIHARASGQRRVLRGRPTPARGELLSAAHGVIERSHEIVVSVRNGELHRTHRFTLESNATIPTEVSYRLPLDGARVRRVRLCLDPQTCRDLEVHALGTYSGYDARLDRGLSNAFGTAELEPEHIHLRAAPVNPEAKLTFVVDIASPIELFAGRARATIEGRRDFAGRLANPSVRFDLEGYRGIEGAGAHVSERAITMVIEREATRAQAVVARRGGNAELFVASPSATPQARDLVLLIDGSASMVGAGRNHVGAALSSLLDIAPAGSRLKVLAFAHDVTALVEEWTPKEDIDRTTLLEAVRMERGQRTNLGLALERAQSSLRGARSGRGQVVIFSDGQLTQMGDAALPTSRRAPLHLVNLTERAAHPLLGEAIVSARGVELSVAKRAAGPSRGGNSTALQEQLATLFAPTTTNIRIGARRFALRAGTSARVPVAEGERARVDGRTVRLLNDNALEIEAPAPCPAARTSPPFLRVSAPRACGPAPTPVEPIATPRVASLNAEALQRLLRRQVIPAARACLRSDRRGRPYHSVEATYRFDLEDGELSRGEIEGEIASELRQCLLDSLSALRLPRFVGRVRVRYPIHTQAEERQATIELDEDLRRAIVDDVPLLDTSR